MKVLSRNYPYVIFLQNSPNGMFKSRGVRQQYRRQFLAVDEKPLDANWKQMMSFSICEAVLETACNM